MRIFYSPSLRGFFGPDVHDPMPVDAVHRVTTKRHAELLAGQEQGARIVPGPKGAPVLEWPDRSAAAQRAELARAIKREARRRINAFAPAWRQLNDLREPSPAGAARFAAVDAIRSASAALEAIVADLPAGALAAFDTARHSAWPAVSFEDPA